MKELLHRTFVTVNGHRMLTRCSAERARFPELPVIFLPGLALSGRYMVPAAFHLSQYLPVYIPDFPGLGESSKPADILDLRELARITLQWMDALRIHSAVMVGNSFGSQIAAELAASYPGSVRAAVLIGLTVDPERRTFLKQLFDLVVEYAQSPAKAFVIAGDIRKCGLRRLYHYSREALKERVEERLPEIACPVLFLRGSRDPLTRQKWLEKAAALTPHGTAAVMPGIGHTPNFDRGEELAFYILRFLTGENLIPEPEADASAKLPQILPPAFP